jgi:predicted amidohydrolase YtcJ
MHWLLTGKTLGGMQFWPASQVLDKFTALQLYTTGSAWFSNEENLKGKLIKGMYADFAVLTDDFFTASSDKIKQIESVLTVVNGRIVYAAGLFKKMDPVYPAIIPEWSPVKYFGGYQQQSK